MSSLRFDAYMDRVLYGPDGFYSATGSAGSAGRRDGDFLTSPEVGPLFGAVLAEAIDGWWTRAGRPDPFTIYDVGCGPGTLLRTLAVARGGADLGRPWNLVGVDVAGAGADRADLPEDLSDSVVIANELLDNLPFRIIERTAGGWSEVEVVPAEDDGPATERLVHLDEAAPGAEEVLGLVDRLGLAELTPGSRVPVQSRATAWVDRVLAGGPTALCVFDYGLPTTAGLARRGGWLRTYRDHRRGDDPLVAPGRIDITTDIGWDQLPTPSTLSTQAEVLRSWGIERLVEEGRAHWKANAHAPDLTAIRMRSRVTESAALLDQDGLGGWWVAIWETAAGETG
ncbi:MAG: SAM-dependent methyltransferase [Actinomycetota bacterium]